MNSEITKGSNSLIPLSSGKGALPAYALSGGKGGQLAHPQKAISCLFLLLFFTALPLFPAIIITRDEGDIISKELYHQNYFAEIHNDKIVSLYDFNNFEITHIDHQLRIYTTINFTTFQVEMERQNQAQIQSELRANDPDRMQRIAAATNALFSQMQPGFIMVDTLDVCGYKSFEYHVYNGAVIQQKLWISKALQEKIDREVNPANIKQLENVLKNNRQVYLQAMGIGLDPISSVVEQIEAVGYIVKRVDYGLRNAADPELESEMDKDPNQIIDILERDVDPVIFTAHQSYKKVSYSEYLTAVYNLYGG